MKYEIRKVASKEYIYNKLEENSEKPMGIIVFGPDFPSKQWVLRELYERFPNLIRFDETTRNLTEHIRKMNVDAVRRCGAIVTIPGECSFYTDERTEYIEWLRCLGVKTVIGIYVKKNVYEEYEKSEEKIIHNNQLMMMLECPPMTREFDYYIIVS